jgi:hypothetical protein
MVQGVAFRAYVLSIAFGPKLATLSAVEIPTGFFVVYFVYCTPLL